MKNISENIHKNLCKVLDQFDKEGAGTKLERKAYNLLEIIFIEWEYIQNKL
jgi:hypothetical protein